MKMRFLGKTGLQVSVLCMGTATFGGLGEFAKSGTVSQKEADYLVSLALDAGINFFNTAEMYSQGLAEEYFGKALGPRRQDAIVITKVNPIPRPGKNDGGLSRKHIIEGCEASLKRLGMDYVDLYELHGFDPETRLEVTIRALDDLIKAGKIRYFGCSNFTAWQMMKGLAISEKYGLERFVTLEAMYSLASRELEYELVPACLDQGIAILAYSPMHAGLLSGKYRRGQPWPKGTRFDSPDKTDPWPLEIEKLYDTVEELYRIASRRQVSVSQVAMNYVLQKPGVCSIIIGTRKAAQLQENLKAVEWDITAEETAGLDKISRPRQVSPYFVHDPLAE
jgi:aryl-alcohol dehydrogenase-like predicted oxidoreductase